MTYTKIYIFFIIVHVGIYILNCIYVNFYYFINFVIIISIIISQKLESDHRLLSRKFPFQTNHTDDHVGLFYTVPDSVQRQLFSTGGLPKSFAANIKTFTECSFMVRKPAVDLIQRLNATDFSRPPVRHVLCILPGN